MSSRVGLPSGDQSLTASFFFQVFFLSFVRASAEAAAFTSAGWLDYSGYAVRRQAKGFVPWGMHSASGILGGFVFLGRLCSFVRTSRHLQQLVVQAW